MSSLTSGSTDNSCKSCFHHHFNSKRPDGRSISGSALHSKLGLCLTQEQCNENSCGLTQFTQFMRTMICQRETTHFVLSCRILEIFHLRKKSIFILRQRQHVKLQLWHFSSVVIQIFLLRYINRCCRKRDPPASTSFSEISLPHSGHSRLF